MNSHEEQLILELASGSLPNEEAQRLEASLSEEAQRELAAHRLVLGAIAESTQPKMTDIERARVHRGVSSGISEITRELAPTRIATQQTPQRRRTIHWMRFASAATAAAVLVGVVAVGTQLAGSGGSDSSDTTSPAASAAATTIAAESLAEDADVVAGAGSLQVTPSAAQTTTSVGRSSTDLMQELPEAPPVAASTEEADLEDVARFLTSIDPSEVGDLTCFAVAQLEANPGLLVKGFTLMYNDLDAVGFQTEAVDDEEAIRIYDPQTCEELATAPR